MAKHTRDVCEEAKDAVILKYDLVSVQLQKRDVRGATEAALDIDDPNVRDLAFKLLACNEAYRSSAFARMKVAVERIAHHPWYPGKEKLVTEALCEIDQAVERTSITLTEKNELYRILGSHGPTASVKEPPKHLFDGPETFNRRAAFLLVATLVSPAVFIGIEGCRQKADKQVHSFP